MSEIFSRITTTDDMAIETGEMKSQPGQHINQVDSKLEIPPSVKPVPFSPQVFGFENAEQEQAIMIDEYVNRAIRDRGLEDSEKSYNQIADELMQMIGIDENELGYNKFLKVANLVIHLIKFNL